jgi:hypothetical protein
MKTETRTLIKSVEDLDVRSFNVYKCNFGSIEALIDYYNENGDFFKLRNSGANTNIQLVSLCKSLLKNLESESDEALNTEENYIDSTHEILALYQSLKRNLSVRANNVLEKIERESKTDLDSFIKSITFGNIDFISIRNCGQKTKSELQFLANKLKNKNAYNDIIKTRSDYSSLTQSEFDAISELYLILKNGVSVRASNILSKLETDTLKDTKSLIKAIVLSEINFLTIRNCGEKTKEELQVLATNIREFYLSIRKTEVKIETKSAIQLKISRLFPKIPKTVIEQVVVDENCYNASKLLCTAIYFNEFKDSKCEIIQELFNSKSKIEIDKIADKLSLSKERIRQILKEFHNKDIETLYSKIKYNLSNYEKINFEIESRLFLQTDSIDFEYLGSTYTPNRQLLNEMYNHLLQGEYENCLDIYNSINSEFNAFNKSSLECLYISKNKLNEIRFIEFLKWIEEQLYNFEKYDIDFDTEVLILRFYDSENKIDFKLIKELSNFVTEYKSDFSGTAIRRKGERELKKMDTVNLCYSFIEQENHPVKTNELLDMLYKNGIQVEKQELLKLLNIQRDQFSSFGHGAWALSSWRSDGLIGGSLRDIVLSLLNNSDAPLHVSEILNYLAQFRPVTLRSLLTNLRSANNGVFLFLNCNFIGVQSKNYKSYWFELPRINGRHFGEDMLMKARQKSNDIPEYYFKKYNYPKINTEFLLNQKGNQ